MQIRYTPPEELELLASEHELHRIARALRAGAVQRVPADRTGSPAPYLANLHSVAITPTNGPAEVAVVGTIVSITGSAENLDRLASFFQSAAESGHAHFEWFAGNEFVAQTTTPLVIARA